MDGTNVSTCPCPGRRTAAGMYWFDESKHVERSAGHDVSRPLVSSLVPQTGPLARLSTSLPLSPTFAAASKFSALGAQGTGAHVRATGSAFLLPGRRICPSASRSVEGDYVGLESRRHSPQRFQRSCGPVRSRTRRVPVLGGDDG